MSDAMNTITRTLVLCITSLTVGLPAMAWAQSEPEPMALPDIQYGMWETTTVTAIRSDMMNMPENSQTTQDCVTEEDVRQGRAFMQDQDTCKVLDQNITSSTMDMTMDCAQEGTGAIRMEVSFQFSGDHSQGTMSGEIDSPMGKMFMDMKMESRRIGDC